MLRRLDYAEVRMRLALRGVLPPEAAVCTLPDTWREVTADDLVIVTGRGALSAADLGAQDS
jgi:hypothetical protein